MRAEHVLTQDMRDVRRMAGSKYVQSFISPRLYSEIAGVVDEEKDVLFAGMPCQVAAMRAYHGDAQGLMTVDFPCYGVPSPAFFKAQVCDIERKKRARVTDFSFRDKRKNGFSHTTVIELKGKRGSTSMIVDDYWEIPYHHAFGKCDCFDEPCYRCDYNRRERVSDITLGSFWDVDEVDPSFDVRTGVSMVLPNTMRGIRLWESIAEDFKVSEQPVDVAIAHNEGVVKGKERPAARSEVYRCLASEGFPAVARRFYGFSFVRHIYGRCEALKRLRSLFR